MRAIVLEILKPKGAPARARAVVALVLLLASRAAAAQMPSSAGEIYGAWCARCHAADGTGRVDNPTVKTVPMNFTDCSLSTPEPNADWELVIAEGGRAAGLSAEMPAFGDVLNRRQVGELIDVVRGFCAERGWPPGDLNFPRALFTEKAFPEDELVTELAISHRGEDDLMLAQVKTIYERRFGRRGQVEVALPLLTRENQRVRFSGVGDVSLAAKAPLLWDRQATQILTAAVEITFPTGRESNGLGKGTPVFEPYLAYARRLANTYFQSQLKLELPARSPWFNRELVYNIYMGRDASARPSTWTAGIELNGENREVAVTPQVRKGLTRTGALAAAVGVRLPINQREEQGVRWAGYLLWEYREPVRPRR